MNKSSKNLLAAFVAGVGAGVWAGLEFGRLTRKSTTSMGTNPWGNEGDDELQEWLASLKGKSLEELREIQMDLMYETDVFQKEQALRRIILRMESEEFNKNFQKTSEEIRAAQRRTSDRIERFRKEMDSQEEI